MREADLYPRDDDETPLWGSGDDSGGGKDDAVEDMADVDEGTSDEEESDSPEDVDEEIDLVDDDEEEHRGDADEVPPGFQKERGFGPAIKETAGEGATALAGLEDAGVIDGAEKGEPEASPVQAELFPTGRAKVTPRAASERMPSLEDVEKWAAEQPEAAAEEPEPPAPAPAAKAPRKKAAKKTTKKAKKKAAKKKAKKKAAKKKAKKKAK